MNTCLSSSLIPVLSSGPLTKNAATSHPCRSRFHTSTLQSRSLLRETSVQRLRKYGRHAGRQCETHAGRLHRVCASAVSENIEESTLTTASGLRLEVLSLQPGQQSDAGRHPPIVFVHGSYHAAWSWAIHFMPAFAEAGYEVHALSLRGQGRGDHVEGAPTLDEHAADLGALLAKVGRPSVVFGHSFGGSIVQRYLADPPRFSSSAPPPAAAVLACSVPPYGNGPMIARFLRSKPLASLRLTWSLAARAWEGRPALFRETFFSPDLPDPDLERYMELMSVNSRGRLLDLSDLNKQLPLATPPFPSGAPAVPVLVMGARNDFCVDVQGVEDTAHDYATRAIILEDMNHDIMLDTRWSDAVTAALEWLQTENL